MHYGSDITLEVLATITLSPFFEGQSYRGGGAGCSNAKFVWRVRVVLGKRSNDMKYETPAG